MQYFVLWPDGQKFGPADVPTLQQWINEGRLTADSELESVIDGSRCKVSDVPGLSVGAPAAPMTPAAPVAPATPDPVTTTTSTVFSSTPVQSATPAGGSYFVIGPDGSKYGPADVPTLSSWATENRLTSATEVEDATTGVRMTAAQIPGIVFPQATATTSSIYGGTVSNPTPSAGYSNPAYTSYPRDGASSGDNGQGLITASFICSGLGLICCPCVFSITGIVLGVMGKNKGNEKGQLAIILGVASLVLGIILGVAIQAVTGNLIPR